MLDLLRTLGHLLLALLAMPLCWLLDHLPALASPRAVYNCSVLVGVLLVSIGVGVGFGLWAGLVAGGALVLVLAIYSAERLIRTQGGAPDVLDRRPRS